MKTIKAPKQTNGINIKFLCIVKIKYDFLYKNKASRARTLEAD